VAEEPCFRKPSGLSADQTMGGFRAAPPCWEDSDDIALDRCDRFFPRLMDSLMEWSHASLDCFELAKNIKLRFGA